MSLIASATRRTASVTLTDVNFFNRFGAILENAALRGIELQSDSDPAASSAMWTWSDPKAPITLSSSDHPMVDPTCTSVVLTGDQDMVNRLLQVMSTAGARFNMSAAKEEIDIPVAEYHATLNPKLWMPNRMLVPAVQKTLVRNAQSFFEFLELPDLQLLDLYLTGSNANYNWNQVSDLDVHVVVDAKKANAIYGPLFAGYCKAKKTTWNDTHHVTVLGCDVEMYVQDISESHTSTGIYSLMTSTWIAVPAYAPPNINRAEIVFKAEKMMALIDAAVHKYNKAEVFERLIAKIIKMRKSGLAASGEMSDENLVFKVLRTAGYIDRLNLALNKSMDRALSIEDEEWSQCLAM